MMVVAQQSMAIMDDGDFTTRTHTLIKVSKRLVNCANLLEKKC
jgi:hypothetical protein